MKIVNIIVLFSVLLVSGVSLAEDYSRVFINGQRLSMHQLQMLEQQLGGRISSGYYLYNAYNQCWANLTTGQAGCFGSGAGSRVSGSGSGEWDGQGNWSSWSNYGGGVGGTAGGCIYTANWSNC